MVVNTVENIMYEREQFSAPMPWMDNGYLSQNQLLY
jgi:hypothetical protein